MTRFIVVMAVLWAWAIPAGAQMPDSTVVRVVGDTARWMTLGVSDDIVQAIDTRTLRILTDNPLLPRNVREVWMLAGFRTPRPIPDNSGASDRMLYHLRVDCQGRGIWPGSIVHYLRGEQVARIESPRAFNRAYRDDVWFVVVPGSAEEMLHEWVCSIPDEKFTRG